MVIKVYECADTPGMLWSSLQCSKCGIHTDRDGAGRDGHAAMAAVTALAKADGWRINHHWNTARCPACIPAPATATA